jgi:hypothetical protein
MTYFVPPISILAIFIVSLVLGRHCTQFHSLPFCSPPIGGFSLHQASSSVEWSLLRSCCSSSVRIVNTIEVLYRQIILDYECSAKLFLALWHRYFLLIHLLTQIFLLTTNNKTEAVY